MWLYFGSKNIDSHKYKSIFQRIWIINPLKNRKNHPIHTIRRRVRIVQEYIIYFIWQVVYEIACYIYIMLFLEKLM